MREHCRTQHGFDPIPLIPTYRVLMLEINEIRRERPEHSTSDLIIILSSHLEHLKDFWINFS